MKIFKIYAIRFLGEVIYVGQTGATIESRFYKHLHSAHRVGDSHRVPKLQAHIRSNRMENYTFELLEIVTKDTRYEREKFWIKYFETQSKCNTTAGGVTATGPDHYLYGTTGTTEKAWRASVAARKGKHLSEAHKASQRAGHARTRANRKDLTPVRCVQTKEEWASLTDCAKAFGVALGTIMNRVGKEAPLRIRNKTLGDLTFEYKHQQTMDG